MPCVPINPETQTFTLDNYLKVLTQHMKALGITMPTIYGIILVFSLKFFPFVHLMTESALRNINRSFEEAAISLGATMSFITTINELSSTLLLSSGLCVFVVLRFSQSKEGAFV